MLKNTSVENKMLDREVQRMQQIDRIKVANARTSFLMSDTGKILPSIDVLSASLGNSILNQESLD